jgi:hypothetical protein
MVMLAAPRHLPATLLHSAMLRVLLLLQPQQRALLWLLQRVLRAGSQQELVRLGHKQVRRRLAVCRSR